MFSTGIPPNRCSKCHITDRKKCFDILGKPLVLHDPHGVIHNDPDCFMCVMTRYVHRARRPKKKRKFPLWYYWTFTAGPIKDISLEDRQAYIHELALRLSSSKQLNLTPDTSIMCLEKLNCKPHIHLLAKVQHYQKISRWLKFNKNYRTELKKLRTPLDVKKVLYYIIKEEPHKELHSKSNLVSLILNKGDDFSTT